MTAVRERLTAALADRYRIERELGAGASPRRERQQGTSESTTDGTTPRGG